MTSNTRSSGNAAGGNRPKNGFSRRDFLQGVSAVLGASAATGGLGGAAGLVGGLGASLLSPAAALAAINGPTLPAGSPVLVVVELAGGNDILNTIVPMNVPYVTGYYRAARPTLAIKQVTTQPPFGPPAAGNYLPPGLDLDGAWALHGALPWLANRWHSNHDVAIVHGVGENVMREMSHFAAFAYRWAGAFGGPLMNTGWLGRYNDLVNPNQPLGAVSMAGSHQSLTANTAPAVAIADIASFSFNVNNIPDKTRWLTDLNGLGDATGAATNKVGVAAKALDNARLAMATAKGVPKLASGGSTGSLGGQLTTAASLINAGIPCQTYVATVGGFDTHGSEPYNHFDMLQGVNAGLAHFFSLIDAGPRAGNVFVLVQSEFGRQVTQNAGQGTDHGLGSAAILIGGGVKGGMYGQVPNLAPAARYSDALVPTVDFRTVYSTVLNRLGGSAALTAAALGPDESNHAFGDLGIFTTGPPTPPPTIPPGSTTTTLAAPSTTTTLPSGAGGGTTTTTKMPEAGSTTTTSMPMVTTTTKAPTTTTTLMGTTTTTQK